MLLDEIMGALKHIRGEHGNIEVQLQSTPKDEADTIGSYELFFIVPERYEEPGEPAEWRVNIRSWPY